MVDYQRSGNIRGSRGIWGGHSKDLDYDKRPRPSHVKARVVIAAVASIAAGALGYMVGDRQPPLIRYWGVILPENPPAGSEVSVQWDIQWFRPCTGKVYRQIVDSHKVIWDFEPFDTMYTRAKKITETNRRIELNLTLPKGIALGPAEYFAVVRLKCNWLQEIWPIVVDTPTIKFNIVESPKQ